MVSETVYIVFVKARNKQEVHVTPMKLEDRTGTVVNGQVATQQDKVLTFSSIWGEDENGKAEPVSSSEPTRNEMHANLLKDVNGEDGVPVSKSFSVNINYHEFLCMFIF